MTQPNPTRGLPAFRELDGAYRGNLHDPLADDLKVYGGEQPVQGNAQTAGFWEAQAQVGELGLEALETGVGPEFGTVALEAGGTDQQFGQYRNQTGVSPFQFFGVKLEGQLEANFYILPDLAFWLRAQHVSA